MRNDGTTKASPNGGDAEDAVVVAAGATLRAGEPPRPGGR
jgi:hypothetical protein